LKEGIFPGLRAQGSRHLVETEIIGLEELERENHYNKERISTTSELGFFTKGSLCG
jgi:hypothetical protein